jgi:hypothetical protein
MKIKLKKKRGDMSSTGKLMGVLQVKVIRGGEVIESYADRNLIVNSGFNLVQQLLSSAAADKHITKLRIGEFAEGDPAEPDAAWTDIPNEILTKSIGSVSFPSARSVSFNTEINGSEANDTEIAHFGLLSEDETLFAAKVRAPIAKTSDIVIQTTWIIHF